MLSTAQYKSLNDLACNFFREFSRTEYSLKAAGYNNGDGKAKADWTKFSLDVEQLIANPTSKQLEDAINFILKAPPKEQVICNGVLEWRRKVPSTNSPADMLLLYVRRVRNNLFHGGKFNDCWFDSERSEPLLRHSLTILKSCVEAVPSVRRFYNG